MKSKTILLCKVLFVSLTTVCMTGCTGQQKNDPLGNSLAGDNPVGIERFGQVHQLLEEHVEQERIAGASALVIQDGEVVYRDYVGWMNVEEKKPVSDNTIFRIASMTKAVTSVAVMLLHEEGMLSLSDPVSKFIPAFSGPSVVVGWEEDADGNALPVTEPADRKITIHDLLSHTSGLSYAFMGDDRFASLYKEAGVSDGLVQTEASLAENIERLASVPLMYQPGTTWQYSLSHDVLGRVIEVASGESLNMFFQERIFKPLKMDDTHFFIPEEKKSRLATLYTVSSDQHIAPTGTASIQAGNLIYSSIFHHSGPQTYYSGGAGLVSTLSDYGRFLQMLLNGGELEGVRILQPEGVQKMTANQIGSLNISPFTDHGDKFGYGFGVLTEGGKAEDVASVGTYSWGGIFNTYYWADPEKEMVGIIMTQLFPYDHLSLRGDFKKAVYNSLEN